MRFLLKIRFILFLLIDENNDKIFSNFKAVPRVI